MPEMAGELSEKPGLSVVMLLRQCARTRLQDQAAITEEQRARKRLKQDEKETKEQIARNPIILEGIFRHLAPSDILSVALVCRTWNEVVEQPRFWAWASVSLAKHNFRLRFYSRRFWNVGHVRLEYYDDSFEFYNEQNSLAAKQLISFFKAAKEHDRFSSLDAEDNFLSCVPVKLLCEVLVGLKEVNLDCADLLDNNGAHWLLWTIETSKQLKLRNLSLGSNLSAVPAKCLSRALLRLETVSLANTHLSLEQINHFFLSIINSQQDLRLKRLTIGSNITLYRDEQGQRAEYHNMIYANQDYFARAIVRVKEVSLPKIWPTQVNAIFEEIKKCPDLKLRKLNIDEGNDLTYVPSAVFAEAVLKVEEINLMLTRIRTRQAEALCVKILETKQFKLRTIKVDQTHPLLALPHIIIRAVKEKVKISTFYY